MSTVPPGADEAPNNNPDAAPDAPATAETPAPAAAPAESAAAESAAPVAPAEPVTPAEPAAPAAALSPETAPVAPPVAPVAAAAPVNPYAPAPPAPPANPYAPAAAAPTGPPVKNTLGLVALIIAIVGFVLACLPWTSGFAWIPLLAALIIAIVGLTRRGQKKGTSIAALILSVVGWIVSIVVFFVSLAVLATNAYQEGMEGLENIEQVQEEPTTTEGGEAAAIGDTLATANGVEVTVSSMECGLPAVGSAENYTEEQATGEFCTVEVLVNNAGSEQITVSSMDFAGYIEEAQYSASFLSSTFGDNTYTAELNPGLSTDVVLNFDVPAGSQLETLQFKPLANFMDDPLVFAMS